MQCFGQNFEVFEQLQSPEWQLCEAEDKLHICATDAPTGLTLYWKGDGVREDSFQEDLRRNTARTCSNFFLDQTNIEYVNRYCPIDNNYV